MARLTDERIIELFVEALSNGSRGVGGYVVWRRLADDWLRRSHDGETQRSAVKAMLGFVNAGGEIDQTRERRDPYASSTAFHYDFRFRFAGQDVYIETVINETRTGPVVTIVNMHLK